MKAYAVMRGRSTRLAIGRKCGGEPNGNHDKAQHCHTDPKPPILEHGGPSRGQA